MRIAIIGTGRMASNLAVGWSRAGHEVVIGSRHPEKRQELLDQVPVADLKTIDAALHASEVVIVCIPFTAVESFVRAHATHLRGKLVVDISNPFDRLPDNRVAGAEITAQAIGAGARVVAAFKTNFWDTLLEPVDPQTGSLRDVFFAGDNTADKEIVARLIRALGFRPVDCGVLRNARILDGMVPLIVELDRRYTGGERLASWKLLD